MLAGAEVGTGGGVEGGGVAAVANVRDEQTKTKPSKRRGENLSNIDCGFFASRYRMSG
jgi:hypothetical protein